jgi:NosR/NirI family transcriptional regulator, nitrous oxide reductase regulator
LLNIINDNFKNFIYCLFASIIVFSVISKISYSTPMPKEDKDINSQDWVLTQYLTTGIKIKSKSGVISQARSRIDEIIEHVVPINSNIGDIIYNEEHPPLAEIIKNGSLIGYIFETYDWVKGLGYSRKPYHIIAGIDLEGKIIGIRLMWHTEPIAILGRTDQDLYDFLEQLHGVSINKGISIVLGLSDSVLEGEKVAMRETAGDVSELKQVDGISRTTTTSLLLNDAVMRAARKVARYKNIALDDQDLGVILNLENYTEQNWVELIESQSVTENIISNGKIVEKFNLLPDIKAPRKVRLSPDEALWTKTFMAIVNPEGIGANILGRRWYDQYVVTGRNVDDLVLWVGFLGPGSFYDQTKSYEDQKEFKSLFIMQDGNKYLLTPQMYKPLPFHHAKGGPKLIEQGLFYFSKKQSFDPTKSFNLHYKILGDKQEEYNDNNNVNFVMNYQIPDIYINTKNKLIDNEGFNWQATWKNKLSQVTLAFLTVISAIFILIFKDAITKNRKVHIILRTGFLIWILFWLGWLIGGQVSIIHLAALVQALFDGQGFASFLAEPVIVIVGVTALISMPIWGRALFCGWLCPFGALQELLNKCSIYIGVRQKRISEKSDRIMKLGKYVLLFLLTITFLYSFDLGLKASAIEPFKSAITFRFNAPALALAWVVFLLFIGIFIERAYCRFLCPLGAAASIIGKVRIFNFLHRRVECGNPCKACSPACPTQAIKFNGEIDMNECFQCLDCQVMYFDKHKCPPLVAKYKNTKTGQSN